MILLFSLSSCFSPGHSEGIIIDQNTLLPIYNAQITVEESYTVYTDNQGHYEIFGTWGLFSDLELLVEKKGYEPKYINVSASNYDFRKNITIKLLASDTVYKPSLPRNQLRFVNSLIKIIFSLLNILTLIFIVISSEIRKMYIWITGILFINLIFNLLYLDYNLISYEIIHAPFFLTGYWNNPYSLKIAFPVVSIAFWILYLTKSRLIKKDTVDAQNGSESTS